MGKGYYAGVDSGSTSTDVVILNKKKEIVASVIMLTGAGAANGAERAPEEDLKQASLVREDLRIQSLQPAMEEQLFPMAIKVPQKSPVMQEGRHCLLRKCSCKSTELL